MSSAIAEQPSTLARRRTRASNDLVSLAAPVLELVLKVQAGLVAPSNTLRPTVERLLDEMEQRGTTLRFNPEHVSAAKFALASFVDETVLTADFPLREEWEKYPLQLKYFGEHLAGVKFFDRLDALLKGPEANADVIEVYYVCMLLGYKGKYKVYMEDQLKGVIQNTAEHLRRVQRLHEGELSPHWRVNDQPQPQVDPGIPLWMKVGSGTVLALVVLIFIVLKFLLGIDLKSAAEQLQR